MAKIINHSVSGRLGELIMFSHNGNGYVKTYTKPKDPKTPKQLAYRNAFSKITKINKAIYADILRPYTFSKPNSANNWKYNRMMEINGLILKNCQWDPANLKIFEGPLENPGISQAVLAGNVVTVSFNMERGKSKDVAIAVVYDDAAGRVFYAIGTRSAGSIMVSVSSMTGLNTASLHAYLVFSRVPGTNAAKSYFSFKRHESKGLVSTTAYKKVE
jgi:hypothetical protein